MSVQGKKVVVLGGTAGIGLATARSLATAGAEVVVASSRESRVAQALASLPPGASGHVVDLSREAAVRQLFETVGAFDHLVYTAGESLKLAPLASIDLDEARRFFELRYWGALTAARYASTKLRRGGSIAFTGGIAAARPQAGWSLGASICGAMESLTRALAVELAPIRVNLVSPGVVQTELWSNLAESDREAMFRTLGQSLPVGRIGEPDDIAQAFLFLLANEYCTGQIVTVDGGGVLV